jgi:DNA-binding XRE family transcriptional regulator
MVVVRVKLNIKQARLERKLTQKQLAEKIGVEQSYISRLEDLDRHLNLYLILKIAMVLNVCPYLLVDFCSECEIDNIDKKFCVYIRQHVILDIQDNTSCVQLPHEVKRMAGEKFTIYMDEDLKKTLKKVAIDQKTSASEIISRLVIEYLNNIKSKNVK